MITCVSLWLALTVSCGPSLPRQFPFPEPRVRLFAEPRRKKGREVADT